MQKTWQNLNIMQYINFYMILSSNQYYVNIGSDLKIFNCII